MKIFPGFFCDNIKKNSRFKAVTSFYNSPKLCVFLYAEIVIITNTKLNESFLLGVSILAFKY